MSNEYLQSLVLSDSVTSKKVLIVDDFKTMRTTMKKSLMALGFKHFDMAENGAMAIQFLKAKHFDMVISDWNMPEVTGLEVLHHVKGDPDLSHIHFMLVTAEADRYKIEKAITSGVDEFLIKPFPPVKLREKLHKMLSRSPRKKTVSVGSTEPENSIIAPQAKQRRADISEILIVDDEPSNIELIRELLKAKFKVRAATSGEKALKIAESSPNLDLILLDIMMPEMDGYQVCEALQVSESASSIPVIFLSAKTQTEDMTKGFALGAVDYVTKPIDPPVLVARVESHVHIKRARDNLSDQLDGLLEAIKLREEVERITQHDLKSPLSAAITTADQLLESAYLGVEQRASIELIRDANSEVIQMINRSLDLFKMEQGTYEFKPESLDMVKLCQRVVGELRASARSSGVKVLFEGPLTAVVLAEELLTRSMLGNLIKNAIEASKKKDAVKVAISVLEEVVQITIQNPAAIPESLREQFFEKYATAGKEGGTGIGTYSAKMMAIVQKGDVRFTTSVEEGTCLFIELPIDPDAVQSDNEKA